MNISVTDLETGVIANALNITYPTVAKVTPGYTTGGSGSQAGTPIDNKTGKSHNHE